MDAEYPAVYRKSEKAGYPANYEALFKKNWKLLICDG